MMKLLRHVLAALLVLCLAVPVVAQERAKKRAGRRAAVAKRAKRHAGLPVFQRLLKDLTLTDEQQAQLKELKEKFGPKFQELSKQKQSLLTDEQRKAMVEARKEAIEAGKKGKEVMQAVLDALNLTDEQEAKWKDLQQAQRELQKEVREAVMEILTDEQKAQLQEKLRQGRGPGKRQKRVRQQ